MKSKRVSITDIAKELQISPSTVSRALNDTGKISEPRKKEILDLAKKMGYRPNPFAKGLVQNKTKTIGLLIPEFTHHFYSRMLEGIESVTSKAGYQLIICTSNEKQKQEIKACQTFLNSRVDGVLATVCKKNEKVDHLQEIINSDIQLVFMDRQCEELEASHVISNDFDGAFQAVEYLIKNRYKRTAHIKGPKNLSTTFNRLMGYKESLKKANLSVESELILESDDPYLLKENLKNLLMEKSIDSLFAYSDYLAYDAYQVAFEIGLKIPQDLAIIGFADEPISQYISPSLSTVNQKPFEMGAQAAQILLNQIKNSETPCEYISLQTELMIRDSI
ncbi:LacI family DNA-binding transcriptional regulator [Algoriphagus vanfongensis]|uniref:LacI family DNA-binding transcriptional regulator n=1 Tax=Algoriphagus vanfongensis TaxID=426371 RepID=UPI0003FAD5C2|nr:LacI family DNA-binding transcriptional regulator [Algoriphagus vanfongensis]